MNIAELSIQQLNQVIKLKAQIAKLEVQLAAIGGSAPKRGISKAGKARIVAAQKRRWAKVKAAKTAKPAKQISAAGIARIKAAQKKRWAKIKAEKQG